MAELAVPVSVATAGWPFALRLQAALLGLDYCTRSIDKELARREPTDCAATLGQAVDAVWRALGELGNHAAASLATVPAWLGPAGSTAGITLLLSQLRAATGPWAEIAEQLRVSQRLALLTGLAEEWADILTQSDAPTARVQEPAVEEPTQLRVVFPVVHRQTGKGFLLELVIAPGGSGEEQPADRTEPRLTERFKKGVRAGQRAALQLASRLGAPIKDTECWESIEMIEVVGVPRDYTVDDRSVGTPTAVALVRHLLALPALRHIVTGEISEDGAIGNLPPEQTEAKAAAAADVCTALLRLPHGSMLAGACAELWPADWQPAVRRLAAKGLHTMGHEVTVIDTVGTNVSAAGTPFVVVRTPTTEDILKKLDAGQPAIIVGGPNASARTTSARQAALEWRERTGGRVLELRLKDGQLADQAALRRDIQLARLATDVPPETHTVVILEDLIPHDDASDLETALTAVDKTNNTVIAIGLYKAGTRWRTGGVATSPSLQRPDDVWDFVNRFTAANALPQPNEEQLRLSCRTANGDIWFLVHLLLDVAPVPDRDGFRQGLALAATAIKVEDEALPDVPVPRAVGSVPTSTAILQAYARRVRNGLSAAELQELRAVAASSLLRVRMPDSMLSVSEDAKRRLRKLGGVRDHAGRWYIVRTSTCRAILASEHASAGVADAEQEWTRTADAQYAALSEFLNPYLRAYDPVAMGFVTAVLSGAAAVEQRLHRRLLPLVTETLTQHLGVDAPPALTARALLAGGTQYEHTDRVRLLSVLLKAILVNGWGSLTTREATTCLRAIRAHRDLPHEARGVPENLLSNYREVLATIGRDIRPMMVRTDPAQAALFVHELGRFYEESTAKDLVSLAVLATSLCDPALVEDYDAAVSLIDAALKYGPELRSATLGRFALAVGVRRLIDDGSHTDASLILARAAVGYLVDGRADHGSTSDQQTGLEVMNALPFSSPHGVARGLSVFRRVDVWSARVVVRNAQMSSWLRTTFTTLDDGRVTPPWQSAELIRTLGGIHAPTLLGALYGPDGTTPDRSTIDALAASILRVGDLRGVGPILSAVAAFDGLWGPGGSESASAQLCSGVVGFVDAALKSEWRGSVVLKTMEALVNAQISANDLRSFLGRCAGSVAAEAEDNDKDHAPRLALLLGSHQDVGTQFLVSLRPLIDDDLLLKRMTGSQSIEARAGYLKLACALGRTRDIEFIERFMGDDWLNAALEDLRFGSVLSALKALQAYDLVLRDAGVEFRTDDLLLAVQDDPVDWAKRLKRLRDPSQMTEALHVLSHLAGAFAVRCLQELDVLQQPGSRFKGRMPTNIQRLAEPTLAERPDIPARPTPLTVARIEERKRDERNRVSRELHGMLQLVQRQFINPGQAVELIHAVQRVDEAGGLWLGEALGQSMNWEQRARALADNESPVHLGNLLRMMVESKLYLPGKLLDKLRRTWLTQAPQVRSPDAAQSMLRGFVAAGAGNPAAGQAWAVDLSTDKIGNRLARGLPTDLGRAALLLRSLDVWGPPGSALGIARSLPDTATLRMDTMSATELLMALETVDLGLAAAHAAVAADLVLAQAARAYVVHSDRHWSALGWLIRTLRRLTGDVEVDARVLDAARDIRQPHIRAWMTGCLRQSLADSVFAESDTEVLESWPVVARSARLVIRSDLGVTDVTAAGEIDRIIERLTPRWRVELLRCAIRDPKLRGGLIKTDLDYLGAEAKYALFVGQPDGAELLTALRSVAAVGEPE